jgi:hypothetical protein
MVVMVVLAALLVVAAVVVLADIVVMVVPAGYGPPLLGAAQATLAMGAVVAVVVLAEV